MLTEYFVPAEAPTPFSGTCADFVSINASQSGQSVLLSVLKDGQWQDVTCSQFNDQVRQLAKGLIASGIASGDRVAIMSRTRFEWTLADFAIWTIGAVGVPVYETSSAEQLQWILSDSGAVALICETIKHRRLFEEVAAATLTVRSCWLIESDDLSKVVESGRAVDDGQLDARLAAATSSDLATIIYTSGTTGRPKGCMLTHANFIAEVDNVIAAYPEVFLSSGAATLLFLPIAHVFGRAIEVACIRSRARMGHAPDITNLLPMLQGFKPTFLLAVPRVFEKVYNSAQQKAIADGKGTIFASAAQTAIDYSTGQDTGELPIGLRIKHSVFDLLVYRKLRAALGGNVDWAISGGAPLGARLGHFFRGVGVTILEGYGLTETTAAATGNRPKEIKVGSVGKPVPGTAVKVAADGELLVRGGQVFIGYWGNPQSSSEVLQDDGWFHTGDIGEIDDDGFVRITGRKKEILVTAGGKNVAPAALEDKIQAHWLISHCMVVGDARPYIAALVTIDPEMFPAWCKQHDLAPDTPVAGMVDDPRLLADVQAAIDDANKSVSHAEAIKRFSILPTEWTEDQGHITPSMKLKRSVIAAAHQHDIDALYS